MKCSGRRAQMSRRAAERFSNFREEPAPQRLGREKFLDLGDRM